MARRVAARRQGPTGAARRGQAIPSRSMEPHRDFLRQRSNAVLSVGQSIQVVLQFRMSPQRGRDGRTRPVPRFCDRPELPVCVGNVTVAQCTHGDSAQRMCEVPLDESILVLQRRDGTCEVGHDQAIEMARPLENTPASGKRVCK